MAKKKGMTLLEVLMSLAIFAILMTTAAASILGSIDSNQKAQSINSVMSNMTVALEAMSRDIRVGSDYSFDVDGLPETNMTRDLLTDPFYYSDDHGVKRKIFLQQDQNNDNRGTVMVQEMPLGEAIPLTASEVDVQTLEFGIFIMENVTAEERQPSVKIKMGGEVNVQDRTATEFYLQTLVSQRLFNDEI